MEKKRRKRERQRGKRGIQREAEAKRQRRGASPDGGEGQRTQGGKVDAEQRERRGKQERRGAGRERGGGEERSGAVKSIGHVMHGFVPFRHKAIISAFKKDNQQNLKGGGMRDLSGRANSRGTTPGRSGRWPPDQSSKRNLAVGSLGRYPTRVVTG